MNRRTALKRAGALAVALGALEAVGPFSFAPVRVGASIVPSDISFDISGFLPVPPQNYGTDVQFQLPPVPQGSGAFRVCRFCRVCAWLRELPGVSTGTPR
jgi:hypothetical protein